MTADNKNPKILTSFLLKLVPDKIFNQESMSSYLIQFF